MLLPVVVCGGGPVGLVLALELAAWQVPVLLVDRHRRASPFPRGRAISTRSMEILRQLDLEREVTQTSLPRSETVHFFAGVSLTAPEFGRVGGPSVAGEKVVSPTAALACPQDQLEALLRRRVVDQPLVDTRFGTELLDARQRLDHVEVRLRSGGLDSTVRTSWLVGADGSRSRGPPSCQDWHRNARRFLLQRQHPHRHAGPPTRRPSSGCDKHANIMLMATLQVKDVPDDLHRELRRRADLDGLSIRDYLLRLIRNDQQRPPATEWLARLRRLEPVDLGTPAADLVRADRAARDLEALPEQRQS